jgi:hypothetical protein
MEEGQTHKHFLPLSWLPTLLEFNFILSAERPKQIVLKTSWWLVSHFDAFHQNSYGENVGRHTSQPQAEVSIRGILVDALVNPF